MFTEVSELNVVNSGDGGAYIENTGNVDVIALNGGSGNATLINVGSVTNSGIIRAANGMVTVQASSPMTINAAVTAGSDILLETVGSAGDDTLTVSAIVQSTSGDVYLIAGGEDVALAGATISGNHVGITATGGAVQAAAASTVDAQSLTVQAATTIDLAAASLTVLNGTPTLASQQFGDAQMLVDFAALGGTVPGSSIANAAFVAPNEIQLGNVDLFSDYLYLKSDTLILNNPVGTWLPGTEPSPGTVNPNVIVQMTPYTAGRQVVVEDIEQASQSGVTRYSNDNHFQQFPGTSLFVGNSLFNGIVGIGQSGSINIGGQNFLVASTGSISGIGNIISTGIVGIVGTAPPPSPPPPTAPTGVLNTVLQQPTDDPEPNVPTEEQTGTETTPDGSADMIAMLERQPLVGGQVEVNNVVLACQ